MAKIYSPNQRRAEVSEAQELLKALSKILEKRDKKTSQLTDSIVAVLEIERKQEQNRIIRLIQADYLRLAKEKGYVFLPEQIDWLIALIKGEQK
jgi:hypothetical protein